MSILLMTAVMLMIIITMIITDRLTVIIYGVGIIPVQVSGSVLVIILIMIRIITIHSSGIYIIRRIIIIPIIRFIHPDTGGIFTRVIMMAVTIPIITNTEVMM
jgi:hypothetical protein